MNILSALSYAGVSFKVHPCKLSQPKQRATASLPGSPLQGTQLQSFANLSPGKARVYFVRRVLGGEIWSSAVSVSFPMQMFARVPFFGLVVQGEAKGNQPLWRFPVFKTNVTTKFQSGNKDEKRGLQKELKGKPKRNRFKSVLRILWPPGSAVTGHC